MSVDGAAHAYVLEEVVRSHGRHRVLHIDHLAIAAQGITALFGPNGAGKTTLLELLAFLTRPDGGRLHFQGALLNGGASLRRYRRDVVLVQQQPVLFSRSVVGNVEFGLKVRGVPKDERRERARRALERVGLGDMLEAKRHKLSGGETKRVALAQALAIEPRVLLLDEPTASVDAANQAVIGEILTDVAATGRTTVILSTHDTGLCHGFEARCVFLEHGRLVPRDD